MMLDESIDGKKTETNAIVQQNLIEFFISRPADAFFLHVFELLQRYKQKLKTDKTGLRKWVKMEAEMEENENNGCETKLVCFFYKLWRDFFFDCFDRGSKASVQNAVDSLELVTSTTEQSLK